MDCDQSAARIQGREYQHDSLSQQIWFLSLVSLRLSYAPPRFSALGTFLFMHTVTDQHHLHHFCTRHSICSVNGRQIQRFKMLLEVRRQELCVSIEHQLRYVGRAEPEPDAMDRATSGYEKESLLERRNQEKQLLRMVEAALSRIREGSFGQCVSCRSEIDRRRLEAVPWTQYCLDANAPASDTRTTDANGKRRYELAHQRTSGRPTRWAQSSAYGTKCAGDENGKPSPAA